MRRRFLLLLLLLASVGQLLAQQEVRIGRHVFVPDQNVIPTVRGSKAKPLQLGPIAHGKHNVLVQFAGALSSSAQSRLQSAGVALTDYLGANAYYATVNAGFSPVGLHKVGLTSVVPIKKEWKVTPQLESWVIPSYAKVGSNSARVQVLHFSNVTTEWAAAELARLGIKNIEKAPHFKLLVADLPQAKLYELAELPWVAAVGLIPAPQEAFNAEGRTMGRGNLLSLPADLGGRGLTGKGVNVGVWDGNVVKHFDYAKRLHQQEFETSVDQTDGHGVHVVGSIGGAGLLDPNAKGVAPEVELYTYNFNKQSNGYNEPYEMLLAMNDFDVYLSSHSYGPPLRRLCDMREFIAYNTISNDFLIDYLVAEVPTFTQVYAAGNDQGACGVDYGTALRRSKNVIYVAALDALGNMTSFSSFGPTDDGRVVPTIAMKGDNVWSTMPNDKYGMNSGTSMATPLVSGHLALMAERYQQLHNGEHPAAALLKALIISTADDVNDPGPDFRYGYGILNAEAAVRALENNQYRSGSLKQGDAPQTFTVAVPAGATRAWVSLAWTDPVSKVVYAYGEPVLVNDLNLSVANGGVSYLPWVLDKDNPSAAPVRKEDNLNNAELVSIDNPNGELTISVAPNRIALGEQEFFVTWHFDTEEPQVTYPAGGELLQQGRSVVVRTANVTAPAQVSLSYDNGVTYRPVATLTTNFTEVTIPADAPATASALLRIVDAKGRVALSPNPFTIMGVPANLRIEQENAATGEVVLAWDPVPEAKEYEVLHTTDREASYRTIVKLSQTKYYVPQAYLSAKGRHAFAVRAIAENGAVGQRSMAVSTAAVGQRNHTSVAIPFSEEFLVTPSPDLYVECGEYVKSAYLECPPNLAPTPGAHVLSLSKSADNDDPTLTTSNPFAAQKAYAKVGLQHLDLTKESGKVFLEVYGALLRGENPKTPALRLEVDGKPVKTITDEEELWGTPKADNDVELWVWDLSEYKTKPINLALHFVSDGAMANLLIFYFKLKRESAEPDVELMNVAGIQPIGAYGKETQLYSFVRNNSSKTMDMVPLYVSVNGKHAGGVVVENLKPYELRKVAYLVDLSTERPDGEFLNLELRLQAENDASPANNVKRGKLYNLGAKYAMKRGRYTAFNYHGTYDELRVNGSRVICDDGGNALGYQGRRAEVLLLRPTTPGKALAATVRSASLLGENDVLRICAANGYSRKSVVGARELFAVRGELAAPVTVLSTALDGALLLNFVTADNGKGQGWEVEVREVDFENTLKIGKVTCESVSQSEEIVVKAEVTNTSAEPQADVYLSIDQGMQPYSAEVKAKEKVKYLKPGETATHTFAYRPTVPIPSVDSIRITAAGYDTDISDNVAKLLVVNDSYCLAPPTTTNAPNISSIALHGKAVRSNGYTTYTDFNTRDTLSVFRDAATNTLGVKLSRTIDGLALGVWVDWNDDNLFGDAASGEAYKAEVNKETQEVRIPLTVPSDAKEGPKRMRLLLAVKDSVAACGTVALSNSDSRDYIVRLYDGPYPAAGDMALVTLETPKVGAPLSNEAEIKVTVENQSDAPVKACTLAYSVDGGAPVVEDVMKDIAEYGGKLDYIFTRKVNLSAHGVHRVKAWLQNDDTNPTNDTLSLEVHSLKPEAAGADYYLHFANNQDGVESLTLSNIASDVVDRHFSYDFMLNLDHPQTATILHGDDFFMIAATEEIGMPHNSIVIVYGVAGDNLIYVTPAGTIKPGCWQHIAIDNTLFFKSSPTIFVDGEEVPFYEPIGQQGTSSMQNLKAMVGVEGSIDNLRFWDASLSQSNARSLAYTATKSLPNDLLEKLVADFSMNEGPDNTALAAGKHYAIINSTRTGRSDNSIWRKNRNLLRSIHFDNQVGEIEQIAEKHYKVTLTANTSVDNVRGIASPTALPVRISYNGQDATKKVAFDFSQGQITLHCVLPNFYGHDLHEEVTISAVKEPSAECSLLSLTATKADNPELSADFTVSPVPSTIGVPVAETFGASTLTFDFTLSKGAAAYLADKPIESPVKVDVAQPTLIKVVAANGRSSAFYTLSLQKANTIAWKVNERYVYYNDTIGNLPTHSSAGLPITYTSDNNNVLTCEGSHFKASGVGTATIIANQRGGGQYAPAAPVRYVVKVLPRHATIAPRSVTIEYGSMPGEIELYYDGLINEDELYRVPFPKYSILKDNNPWIPSQGYLPVGDYIMAPVSADSYVAGNYLVTPVQGTLTVKESAAQTVTFTVFDEQRSPLSGASVEIDSVVVGLSTASPLALPILSGRHCYNVTLDGYAPVAGTFEVVDAAAAVEVVMPKRSLILTYRADVNGVVKGHLTQSLAKGEDAQPVFAYPDKDYKFAGWDDQVGSPSRQDLNVQESKTYTAHFEKVVLTLTYEAGVGGSIEGEAKQQVGLKGKGSQVTAKPDNGCYFIGWSDGTTSAERTDDNVMQDATYTAQFGRVVSLPYVQNFETSRRLPLFIYSEDDNKVGADWKVTSEAVNESTLDGRFLTIADPAVRGRFKTTLYTSRFALAGVTGGIAIEFDYILAGTYTTRIDVMYSYDGSKWYRLGRGLQRSYKREKFRFSEKIPEDSYKGKQWVQLSFVYNGSSGETVLIDNLSVKPENVTGNVQLNYYAGHGGKVNNASHVNITTTAGIDGTEVVAKANAGYDFTGWSDGVKEAKRKDSKATIVEAFFEKQAGDVYKLIYTAGENGRIVGVAKQHNLARGANGSPVIAVPTTPGYAFSAWSDSRKDNPRTDLSVSKDITVQAIFTNQFTLTYVADPIAGGTINGLASQTVTAGSDAATVTAEPSSGFHFVAWSDGVATPERTDSKVYADAMYTAIFATDYTFSYAAGKGGMVSGELKQTVAAGSSGTQVIAKAYEGYVFAGWSDGIATAERTDRAEKELAVTATFKPKEFKLTYTAAAGGELQAEQTTQTVLYRGDGEAVFAKANDGFHFSQWSDGRKDNPRYEKGVVADVTVEAQFATAYTLTYIASTGGSIDKNAQQTVESGADGQEVKATAKTGYRFVAWSDGRADNPRIDYNVTQSITAEALFANIFTVTYLASTGGSITGEAKQHVKVGDDAKEVVATPAPHFRFVRWDDGKEEASRKDGGIVAEATYTAIFAPQEYTLTAKLANGSILDPVPALRFKYAELEQEIFRAPYGGYAGPVRLKLADGVELESWDDGSKELSRTVLLDANKTITATVKVPKVRVHIKKDYSVGPAIAVYDAYSGSMTVNEEQPLGGIIGVNYVKSAMPYNQVPIVETEGMRLTAYKVPGYDLARVYQIVDCTKPARMRIYLADSLVTVRYSATEGGSIDGLAEQKVRVGSTSSPVLAKPNYGWHFVKWSDGQTSPQRMDLALKDEILVSAEFEPNIYTIRFEANGGDGAMEPQELKYNEEFTLTPNAFTHPYAVFKGWGLDRDATEPRYFDGQSLKGLTGDYDAEVRLYAVWEAPRYKFSFSVAASSKGLGSLVASVDGTPIATDAMLLAGTKVRLKAMPNEGYEVDMWSGADVTPADSKATTLLITQETALSVSFKPVMYSVSYSIVGEHHGTFTATVNGHSIINGQMVNEGAEVLFTAQPEEGYEVAGWTGVAVSSFSQTSVTVKLLSPINVNIAFRKAKQNAVESVLLDNLSVTPNPFTSVLHIQNATNLRSVSILTAQGQLLQRWQHNGTDSLQLSAASLPAGVYLLQCEDVAGDIRTIRIVKQ